MFLSKYLETPREKTLITALIFIFVPFAILTFVFCINELRLISATDFGVLDFELAWTPERINQIFLAWGPAEIQHQTFITYIDYAFIPCYSLFGAGLVLFIARKSEKNLQNLGLILCFSFLLAGIFDAIENINLLLMSANEASYWPGCPFFASACATFKISFLLIGLCYFYIGICYLIFKKKEFAPIFRALILIGGGMIIIIFLAVWSFFLSILTAVIYFFMLLGIIYREQKENK
ncbi:MAG TPA: hypothetical protein VMV49_13305 [Candidatus Deferrimicrobium sp.]|nr:hypothetical protein [Candidatus Deferrimicrobium sp.]